MVTSPFVPWDNELNERNRVLSTYALLLLLLPPDIPQTWAGDQRNLPTVACPVNPVPDVLRGLPLLFFLSQQPKGKGHNVPLPAQSYASQVFTRPSAADPPLCHTAVQEPLLLSPAFPWHHRGIGSAHRLASCCPACDGGTAPFRASLPLLRSCPDAGLAVAGLVPSSEHRVCLAPEQVLCVSFGALVRVW